MVDFISNKRKCCLYLNLWLIILFYSFDFSTPVWKTVVLCHGIVRPSVRLSPSVRPIFWTFSTCFKISIWIFIYTFSGWHDMSSLSSIKIGSLWPTLELKLGETQFLLSWPLKSRYKFVTLLALCILLDISSLCRKNLIFITWAIIFVFFLYFC